MAEADQQNPHLRHQPRQQNQLLNRKLLNNKPHRSNLHRKRHGRSPFHSKLQATARMCVRHRWSAEWRVRTMLIWARLPAPAWVDASARTIFKALFSNTDKVEQGRKPFRHRNNSRRVRLSRSRQLRNSRLRSKRNSLLRHSVRLRRKFRLYRVKASP